MPATVDFETAWLMAVLSAAPMAAPTPAPIAVPMPGTTEPTAAPTPAPTPTPATAPPTENPFKTLEGACPVPNVAFLMAAASLTLLLRASPSETAMDAKATSSPASPELLDAAFCAPAV